MAAHASSSGVDPLVEVPGSLQIQSDLAISEVLEQELIFLEMLTRCLRTSKKAGNNSNLQLAFLEMITCCLCKGQKAGTHSDLCRSVTSLYEILIQGKGKKLRRFKPLNLLEKFDSKIRRDCAVLLDSLKSISWSVEEILEFIVCIVSNLRRLSNLKAEIFVSVKNQIRILIEKFSLLEILLHFIVKYCTKPVELKNYLDNHVMNWVHDAATLSLLCLLKGKDENMPQTLETRLSDLLQKVQPCSTPEVTEMFIKLLKDSKPSRSDKLEAGETVAALVDFLLEAVIGPLKEYVAIFRDGLIFMITFLMDPPPEEAAGCRLFTRIDVVVNEVLSHILLSCMDELKVDISVGGKLCLSSLQYKIDEVKIEIRKHINVQVSNPEDFNFPAINSMWFIDCFLENIMEMVKPSSMIAFARHQVVIVQEELLFLRDFLKDIMELRKERDDLRDLWNQIMNAVFLAESAIASCSFVDHPIWYDMLCLSDVIQAMKLVKSVGKKHNCQIYNTKLTNTNKSSSDVPIKQANPASLLQDDVVGMEDDSKKIIDKLTRGTKQLDIVSIVGMPGIGKTTLANKVYNDPFVKLCFNRRAWCCVSQVYNCRELYFDILHDITGVDAHISYSSDSDDDLAEKLRKSLKGQKYLVVFDDIWSIEAWHSLKQSFPNDHKGSRIVFTTRILDLVLQAKLNCIPLRTLTNEESWELFEKKLFQKDSSPPDDIGKIAKNIVKNCQGVPLTVVLVAGVLAGRNIEFWKEVEESTVSGVVGERCRDVVELSYKHLPDHLKPCFLYFGGFRENSVVRSKKLMNLWIGEGFVPRSDKKSEYKVAKTYLSDLVGRSLVIIAKRSSRGGIKACRVHDLLRDLCLVKIQEENFLQVVQKNSVYESSLNHPKGYDCYRLCIGRGWLDSPFMEPGSPFVRSIFCVCDHIVFWNCKGLFNVSLFERFKLLNVLDLESTGMEIGFVGAGISFMVHLRYLSIYRCKSRYIPESIGNLWNLETLIVRDGWECTLPSTFWKMKSLRYVHIGEVSLSGINSHELSELEYMDQLENVKIGSRDEMKELWRRLPRLRKLKCLVIFQDNIEFSRFTDLETLNACRIWWEGRPLRTFDFPKSLKKLTLKGYSVQWEAISIIGELPNLEILWLQWVTFIGEKWETGDGEFSRLKVLELQGLHIKQWSIPDEYNDPFPNLEQLVVKHCRRLEKIPSSLGCIPTLNKIEVIWCSEAAAASAMEILQQQQEMGNGGLQVYIQHLGDHAY